MTEPDSDPFLRAYRHDLTQYDYAARPGRFKFIESEQAYNDLLITGWIDIPHGQAPQTASELLEYIRNEAMRGALPGAIDGIVYPTPPDPEPPDPPDPEPPENIVAVPGGIDFDALAGNDNDRTTKVNEYFGQYRNGVVMLPSREIQTNVQLDLRSGLAIMGSLGVPAREYGRKTRWRYTGSAGSVFKFVNNTNQSYPSDGSPRDGTVVGIEFIGGGGVDILPQAADYPGKTLWYWLFHNIGMNGMRTAWKGYGTGTTFGSGCSHFQGFSETPIDVGGSECALFGSEFSFMDTKNLGAGKPFIRSKLEKSFINTIMITTRRDYVPMEFYGGRAMTVRGVCFDAQDSDPTLGPSLIVNAVDGLIVTECPFKGQAKNGGPIVDIRGGRQIVLALDQFLRRSAGPANTPLIKVDANVGDNQVKVGPLVNIDYDGRIVSARANQVVKIDPSLRYEIG